VGGLVSSELVWLLCWVCRSIAGRPALHGSPPCTRPFNKLKAALFLLLYFPSPVQTTCFLYRRTSSLKSTAWSDYFNLLNNPMARHANNIANSISIFSIVKCKFDCYTSFTM